MNFTDPGGPAEAQRGRLTRRLAMTVLGAMAPLAVQAAACKLGSLEMPIKMVETRAVTTVGINGTPVPLIVDTGAVFSMLTEAAAAQLQLPVSHRMDGIGMVGATGDIPTRETLVKRLFFLAGELPDVEFLVGGNDERTGVMGLLGRNLLGSADAEYDLAHGVIRLMFPEGDCNDKMMAYWAGDTPVTELPLLRITGSSELPSLEANVLINGHEVRAEFDTGATSVITLAAAKRAGLSESDMTPDGVSHGAGHGSAKSWTAPIDTFQIGGETIRHNRLMVADYKSLGPIEMLLGSDFFLSHRIYVSKRQHRMFFTYNGGPVFALNAAADSVAAPAPEDPDQPTDADGFARRGAAFATRGDYARALADLDRACAAAPGVAASYAQRAQVHLARKEKAETLADLDTALKLDPTQSEARLQRASLRVAAAQRDAALEDLQALDTTLAPQSHRRLALAAMYMQLNLPARAIPQWNKWLADHGNDVALPSVLNQRCWAQMTLGTALDQALEDCKTAVRMAPREAAFVDSRAWVYLRRGAYLDALADFDHALELAPGQVWSRYGRGIVQARLGHADSSLADFAAARKQQPSIDADAVARGLAFEPQPGRPTP